MTNSPEGLTFIDHRWDVRLNGYTKTFHNSPENVRCRYGYYIGEGEVVTEVQTPLVVLNGKWVASLRFERNWPVGVEWDQLEMLEYHDKAGICQRLFVSDKPFGFIAMDSEDVIVYPDTVSATGRKVLVYARQVHRGELGRGVPTPTLDYVRQPIKPNTRHNIRKVRERRRGQHGWVQLSDLGRAASMPFSRLDWIDLILGYWQFSGHRNYWFYKNRQEGGQLVDVAWGSSLDIKNGTAEFESMTREQFIAAASENCDELWIRRGFAYTILRLQTLGVQPEVPYHV